MVTAYYAPPEGPTAKKRSPTVAPPALVGEAKVAMSYRLSPAKIAAAQRVLGAATATATIEEALDAVIFRRELTAGTERAFGLPIVEAFPDRRRRGPGRRRR